MCKSESQRKEEISKEREMVSNHSLAAAIFPPTSAMTRIVFPFTGREMRCAREIDRERRRERGAVRESERQFELLEIAGECVRQGVCVFCGERGGG